jgi:biotin operon repressor
MLFYICNHYIFKRVIRSEKNMEHTERVLAYFEKSGEVLRPGAVGEALGLEKKDLDKAIKSLKEEGKIFSPKRCFYQITKE